ncbi:MAG: DUF5615 family PIN-like protein [Ferrimicrobium sp.]
MLGILEPYFPESSHISFVGLEGAKDSEIWSFASESNFVIVTRDSDFSEPRPDWRSRCATSRQGPRNGTESSTDCSPTSR